MPDNRGSLKIDIRSLTACEEGERKSYIVHWKFIILITWILLSFGLILYFLSAPLLEQGLHITLKFSSLVSTLICAVTSFTDYTITTSKSKYIKNEIKLNNYYEIQCVWV